MMAPKICSQRLQANRFGFLSVQGWWSEHLELRSIHGAQVLGALSGSQAVWSVTFTLKSPRVGMFLTNQGPQVAVRLHINDEVGHLHVIVFVIVVIVFVVLVFFVDVIGSGSTR